MRLFACFSSVLMAACTAFAQGPEGIDWQLLAIDGQLPDPEVTATLRIEPDGTVIGQAPCNTFGSKLASTLPAFELGPIRATRMACDRMDEEQAYFDALSLMQSLALEGDRNLILTGPDGRSMEFVLDRMNSLTTCKTCGD